jgi:hypothetical protein
MRVEKKYIEMSTNGDHKKLSVPETIEVSRWLEFWVYGQDFPVPTPNFSKAEIRIEIYTSNNG